MLVPVDKAITPTRAEPPPPPPPTALPAYHNTLWGVRINLAKAVGEMFCTPLQFPIA